MEDNKMRTIIYTSILFLLLPWNLKGDVTDSSTDFSHQSDFTTGTDEGTSMNVEYSNLSLEDREHRTQNTDYYTKNEAPTKGFQQTSESQHVPQTSHSDHKSTPKQQSISTGSLLTKSSFMISFEKSITRNVDNQTTKTSVSQTTKTPEKQHTTETKSEKTVSSKGLQQTSETQHISQNSLSDPKGTSVQLTSASSRSSSMMRPVGLTKRSTNNIETTNMTINQNTIKPEVIVTTTDVQQTNQTETTSNGPPQTSVTQHITVTSTVKPEVSLMQTLTSARRSSLQSSSKLPSNTLKKRSTNNLEPTVSSVDVTFLTSEAMTTSEIQHPSSTLTSTKNRQTSEHQVTYTIKSDETTSYTVSPTGSFQTTPAGHTSQPHVFGQTTENNPKITLTTVEVKQTTSQESLATTKGQTKRLRPTIISTQGTSGVKTTVTSTVSFASSTPTTNEKFATTQANEVTTAPATTPKTTTKSKSIALDKKPTTTSKSRQHNIIESPKDNTSTKSHPGPILAGIVGTVLIIMFIAMALILVLQKRKKRHQTENTDWAGPSPFIESDIQANSQEPSEDGLLQPNESKRISLHSFLPQRLSKRLSALREADEVHMESLPVISTFGKNEQDRGTLNGDAKTGEIDTVGQIKTETDTETKNTPVSPASEVIIEPTATTDQEDLPIPNSDTEANTSPQSTFEDVDLSRTEEGNTTPDTQMPPNVVPSSPPPPPPLQ